MTHHYFLISGKLQSAQKVSSIPKEIDEWVTIREAISHVQSLGCWGISQHSPPQNSFHFLCLEVLRMAVEEKGEVFPILYRGIRSNRPDSSHLILFGSPNRKVAEFYGDVIEYRNIRGLRAPAIGTQSVVSGDLEEVDEEVIFFPV